MEGIDVSEYQGTIDWKKVKKAGKKFAILRAGIGQRSDVKLAYNVQECKAADIPYGVYWFGKALDEATARLEAQACISALKAVGAKPEFGVWYDIEMMAQAKMKPAAFLALYDAFDSIMKANGYAVGLYSNKSILQVIYNALPNRMDAIPVWLAQYNKEITYTGNVDIWQYSDKGRVDGITGDVDLDDLCDLEGYGMDDNEDDDNAETIREKLAQIGVLLKEINEIL